MAQATPEQGQTVPGTLVATIGQQLVQYSGPLPPAEELKAYEDAVPGAAERILAMAEKQSEHRQAAEMKIIETESRDSLLGIVFAFVLGVGCLIAGGAIAFLIPEGAGAIFGAMLGMSGMGSIVIAMLKNTRGSKKDSK